MPIAYSLMFNSREVDVTTRLLMQYSLKQYVNIIRRLKIIYVLNDPVISFLQCT